VRETMRLRSCHVLSTLFNSREYVLQKTRRMTVLRDFQVTKIGYKNGAFSVELKMDKLFHYGAEYLTVTARHGGVYGYGDANYADVKPGYYEGEADFDPVDGACGRSWESFRSGAQLRDAATDTGTEVRPGLRGQLALPWDDPSISSPSDPEKAASL